LNILALDLGTHTGYATLIDGVEAGGTWLLATDKELKAQKKLRLDRRNDMRISALFDRIRSLRDRTHFDWVFFEDVQFLSTQLQAQLWASLRAAVWMHGRDGLQMDCVPTGTLKLFGAKHGGATKEMMAAALGCELIPTGLKTKPYKFIFRGQEIDDNEVDARHLLNFARHKLKI
jgi:hypothetical protein